MNVTDLAPGDVPVVALGMLVSGLVILAFAGDFIVQAAVSIAKRLRIPDLVVGLTIVAFGTSAPELLVAIRSAMIDEGPLALSAVVGSNIANILLVLGVPAVIAGTACNQPLVRRNYIFMLAVSVLFIILMMIGPIGPREGYLLVGLLAVFIILSIVRARSIDDAAPVAEEAAGPPISGGKTVLYLLLGLVGLPIGAHFTVDGALASSVWLGVSKEAAGLILLALGTSLPELAAATAAALRRESGLIIGSVLGSNIFNILSIVGITAFVAPLAAGPHMLKVDVWIMLAAALLLGPFALQRITISRVAGFFFLALYGAFVYFALTI
ncbi:MAG: calcium/sodium antiporter [Pseudomonadota bacterium]